jgi:pimeloyl-ACP methyl ester carboxylesterase
MSTVGHSSFRWLERGDGEPVLLLHGLLGEMDHWEAALVALEETCRAMALSLPLFDPAIPAFSLPELTRYVQHFLDVLDLPSPVVGGNSLGGHLALELALARPDRVSGLILAGSSGLFERGFSRGVPHRPTAQYVREKMTEVFHDPDLVTPEWVERVRRILTDRSLIRRVLGLAASAKRHSLGARLPEIRVPTLLVWGRDDRITPPDVARRFHALIPDSALVFLPECGHAPMLERPEAFAAIARDWLENTRARRRHALEVGELR